MGNSISFISANTHIMGVTNVFGGIWKFRMSAQSKMEYDIVIVDSAVDVVLGPGMTFQFFHINYLVFLFQCNSNCLTCKDTSIYCLSCSGSFLNALTHKCVSPCPTGYFGNTATFTCDLCLYDCLTCTNGTKCATCDSAEHRVINTIT